MTGNPFNTPAIPAGANLGAPKFQWIGSPYLLGFTQKYIPNKIREIEHDAQEAFSVEMAQVTILDNNRQWMVTHGGMIPASVPQHLTYCNVAVRQQEPLMVPNRNRDDRFKQNAFLEVSHMQFYLGQALYDQAGEVMGSFCLLAAFPRPKILMSIRKFKKYAARAQEEIWRVEDEAKRLLL